MTTSLESELIGDPAGSSLEELLAEVFDVTRTESDLNGADIMTRVLTGVAMTTLSRISQASPAGRVLLVEAISPTLADAVAPVLARALAPEIAKALGQLATGAEPRGEDFSEA